MRLTKVQFEKSLAFLRTYAPRNCFDEIARIVKHLKDIDRERLDLRRELDALKQGNMFSTKYPPAPPPIARVETEKGERYYYAAQDELRLERLMRWSKLSFYEIKTTANEWAERNGKTPISNPPRPNAEGVGDEG